MSGRVQCPCAPEPAPSTELPAGSVMRPGSTASLSSSSGASHIVMPAGLPPVRTSSSSLPARKAQARPRPAKAHRQGCFVSVYTSICQCWTHMSADVDPAVSNNRFFFQDSRPVRCSPFSWVNATIDEAEVFSAPSGCCALTRIAFKGCRRVSACLPCVRAFQATGRSQIACCQTVCRSETFLVQRCPDSSPGWPSNVSDWFSDSSLSVRSASSINSNCSKNNGA